MNILFPKTKGIMINMMPIIIGDDNSLPGYLLDYRDIIKACQLPKGSKAYLSINESIVEKGQYQRRPGIHTDGTLSGSWGGWGGGWGGKGGIFLASNDGDCRIWDYETYDVDRHGNLLSKPVSEGRKLELNRLYSISDRTPHEALPSSKKHERQWFRLVADKIGVWWKQHSTVNPFGIQPNALILDSSKF